TFLRDVPELLYLCGPVTIIPGTVAIVLGVMQWRREQTVIEFANWAKSQRRIKMDVMAQRIGKTRFETEKLLGEALDDGLGNRENVEAAAAPPLNSTWKLGRNSLEVPLWHGVCSRRGS